MIDEPASSVHGRHNDAVLDPLAFEALLHAQHRRWATRAVWFATVAAASTALLSAALCVALPLKRVVPYVVYVDRLNGDAQVLSVLSDRTVAIDELIERFWVRQYVEQRERYVPELLSRDYERTTLMSAPSVAADYRKIFDGPAARDKALADAHRLRIEVRSVILDPRHRGIAQVRFTRFIEPASVAHPAGAPLLATLAFRFLTPRSVRESELLDNPMGFQVTAYELSRELAADSRTDSPGTSQPAPGALP